MPFKNRKHAGQLLAEILKNRHFDNPLVIALPRGGVPVGFEIARRLQAPLHVLAVRKIGAPFHREFGIGAITEDGHYWLDQSTIEKLGSSNQEIQEILESEFREVHRQVKLFRNQKPLPNLKNYTVIVVDDGLATGATARLAGRYLRYLGAQKIILAEPVCSSQGEEIRQFSFDELICLETPEEFFAVGQFYKDFGQVDDEFVVSQLRQAQGCRVDLDIAVEETILQGTLEMPPFAQGLVVFAHGSGSSRLSPRNQQVASVLNQGHMATFLFDLLTTEEANDKAKIFNIALLANRLMAAVSALKRNQNTNHLKIGLFGASTGAAAALWAASQLTNDVSAVVSRGGRPDLAISKLSQVSAPTLLIVGELDETVLKLNQKAQKHLNNAELVVIAGATHLFEEPGAMALVAKDARQWFATHFDREVRRNAA